MVVKKLIVKLTKTNQIIWTEELEFNKDGSVKHLPSTSLEERRGGVKVSYIPLSDEDKENIMKVTGKRWPKLYNKLLTNE